MNKITNKALLTLLLIMCAVFFSVTNANNVSMMKTQQTDSTIFPRFVYENLGNGTIAFRDTSWLMNGIGDSIVSWRWNFGDGSAYTSSIKNPIYTFPDYIFNTSVCLTITTSRNDSSTYCEYIYIRTDTVPRCSANFFFYPLSADDTIRYQIVDISNESPNITWRQWSISDGSISSDSSFVHTFDSNIDSAIVCLTIKTNAGCETSVCKTIMVNKCIAAFNYTNPQNGVAQFYNQSLVAYNAATWHWDFGDGNTSNELNPTHTYASGTQSVYACLTVKTMKDTCTACQVLWLQHQPDSCQADFNFNKINQGSATRQYALTNVSPTNSPITQISWSVADSIVSHDSTLVYDFANFPDSSAKVCLSINTSSGCSSSICKTINFNDTIVTPFCKANFFYSIVRDSTVSGPLERNRVYFYDYSSSSSSIVKWNWNFGDGTYSDLQYPSHVYNYVQDTSVMVLLFIQSSNGCTDSIYQFINFESKRCKAGFYYGIANNIPISGSLRSSQVNFYDNSVSLDTVINWTWNFGDGTYSNLRFPQHVYSFKNDTSFIVSLFIQSKTGCTDSTAYSISFNAPSCKANFTYTVAKDSTVSGPLQRDRVYFYDYSTSSDSIITWNWNFGDGTYSNLKNPTHFFNIDKDTAIWVLLYIQSFNGCSDSIYQTVYFVSSKCKANFSYTIANNSPASSTINRNLVNFYDNSTSSDSIITWNWNFGDGTYSNLKYPLHIYSYNQDTAFRVSLFIQSSKGCYDSTSQYIYFKVPSCKANFTYVITKDSTISSLTLINRVYLYDNSTSSDSIINRTWNFGDGTYSYLKNPSHSYRTKNDTTVMISLFIQSSKGCFDSISQNIFIPALKPVYSLSGNVMGKDELLPQGIMVLYKKAYNGYFMLQDANIISNGLFKFTQLKAGKYILYAMPSLNLSEKYFPTYYVNKLHWSNAQIIDLNSNIGGITLKMVSARTTGKGNGVISGSIINNNETTQLKSTRLKSIMSELATPVYLYTPSGEVLNMSLTSESNAFSFDELPYGTYVLKVESLNLTDYRTTITLSPDAPEVNNIELNLENPLVANNLNQSAVLTVRNIDNTNIIIRYGITGEYNIAVVSLSGKVLVNNRVNLEANTDKIITLGSVPKGIYILKLQNKSNNAVTKFLK